MSGLNHLSQILEKQGIEKFKKLLASPVQIFEKIAGNSFSFERNAIGQLEFYKRNSIMPISIVDRTLMKKYEPVISYLTSQRKNIPTKARFYVEYLTNNFTNFEYDQLPKNGLILKSIITKRTIDPIEFADKIGISHQPLIFKGILSTEQQDFIIQEIQKPLDEIINYFNNHSFASCWYSLLSPDSSTSALQLDLSKPIEGLIFEFNNSTIGKIAAPIFQNYGENKTPNVTYHLIVGDMLNFIKKQDFTQLKFETDSLDEKYLEFCCYWFNIFYIKTNFVGVDLSRPDFMKNSEFDLNLTFINNKETKRILKKDEIAQEVFKIFLNSFRKKKKKPVGIFNSGKIEEFNSEIDRISKYIGKGNSLMNFTEIETFKK